MKITYTSLSGLMILEPPVFADQRGYFFQNFQQKQYTELGMPPFVQDNTSRSKRDTIRGLHYQLPQAQAKLVWVSRGCVWDVAIDIRRHSPTFGHHFHLILNDENHLQFYIPAGFAHGFCVLSEEVDLHYKCTDFYAPTAEHGIAWNDPTLNIPWPVTNPILSVKDNTYPLLKDIADEVLFP